MNEWWLFLLLCGYVVPLAGLALVCIVGGER